MTTTMVDDTARRAVGTTRTAGANETTPGRTAPFKPPLAAGQQQTETEAGGSRVQYTRLVLHDINPEGSAPRVFTASVAKSGLQQHQVDAMEMSLHKRSKPRMLNIYSPPRYFNVLAKVETQCSHKEAAAAAEVLHDALRDCIKRRGMSVEEAVKEVVSKYPGHVRHGILFQERGLPAVTTNRRFDRTSLLVSDSDISKLSPAEEDKVRKRAQFVELESA